MIIAGIVAAMQRTAAPAPTVLGRTFMYGTYAGSQVFTGAGTVTFNARTFNYTGLPNFGPLSSVAAPSGVTAARISASLLLALSGAHPAGERGAQVLLSSGVQIPGQSRFISAGAGPKPPPLLVPATVVAISPGTTISLAVMTSFAATQQFAQYANSQTTTWLDVEWLA